MGSEPKGASQQVRAEAQLSFPASVMGLMAVGHPTQSQAAPPAPNPAMVLAHSADARHDRFLALTHKHARSWHAAANLFQETAMSTCSSALVPGGEGWHHPTLQKPSLVPAELPPPSWLCREPCTRGSPAVLTQPNS